MEDLATTADKDFSAQFLKSRKQRRRRRIIASLAVIAMVGGAYYWQTQQVAEVVPDEILVVTIGYGDIENAIPATGALQPKEIVPVGARASGELVEIFVERGDYVEEGQVLAQIDPEEQILRVESSRLSLENQKNQIASRELSVRIAENNFQRTQMLYEAKASTEQELENAENSLLSAVTNLENLRISIQQSETSLQQEEVQLNYTEVKAPLSGTIISLDQKEGATLNASQTAPTIMQIADLGILTVETEISEADVSSLKAGVDVYFTVLGGGDRRWTGNLRTIDPLPTTSNNVVMYKGRFDVDNSDGELLPGMTTQVFFVTSSARNVLTVPLGALTASNSTASNSAAAMPNGAAAGGQGRGQGAGNAAALIEQFQAGGGEITPEMRARIEGFRGGGGGGRRGGGAGFAGGGEAAGGAAASRLAGSIALNEPRSATVQVVQPDGTTVAREITVGAMDRVNAEVITGLVEGEQVVAGVVQARVEEEQNNNNNNNRNNNNAMRMLSGGGGNFRGF